jgi:hypothetical protein
LNTATATATAADLNAGVESVLMGRKEEEIGVKLCFRVRHLE